MLVWWPPQGGEPGPESGGGGPAESPQLPPPDPELYTILAPHGRVAAAAASRLLQSGIQLYTVHTLRDPVNSQAIGAIHY